MTTRINLLPWREFKRERDKKKFFIMFILSCLSAVLLVFIMYYYVACIVENQVKRNQLLQNEIQRLDEQIKEIGVLKKIRNALISRMSIIQSLQSTRTLMVHLFDELIKIMPSGVYATKLERQNNVVTLYGYSESNTNISFLMRNIEHNNWIQSPQLTEIKKMDEKKQAANNEFKLSFVLKPKNELPKL